MSIQKIYDKAKEIKEKYDNENIYKLAEYIEKNNKAREAYNKFIQRNNAFKKADKALIATIANNYDAIAEEVKKAVKKAQ
ncbi:MAG: hypothetical protein GX756_02045 [Clostridiales bacterium]|nr:hypothetical protein [Clostridiales bacterium]